MAKKKIETMITAFRDGFQSVYGARVFTKDYLPAIEACVAAGITHFEAGGGAMFQSAFFYCRENAFDAMDAFRKAAGPNANLQTLARGVNVVCLDSQSSDIIKLHAQMFKKHGITTIRNFDALNDVNNLIYSGKCIHEAGLRHEVTVTMMELPPGCEGAHTAEFYTATLRAILDEGIPYSSVAFKDASGTSTPSKVFETIRQARKMLPQGTHIVFHSHDTAGTCVSCYQAAINGGADQIDLSMAPVSGGTCQSDVISMWHALRGSEFDLDLNVDKILEAEMIFKECMKNYFVPPEAMAVEPLIPFSPMPGGALTANTQMLRDNNLMDKYPACIKAMSEVVRKGGFGTSVTPVSQFYFQQAFNNVMFGPWKKIAEGYGKMVLGYFGKTPVAPDPEIVRISSEQLKLQPTTKPVLEMNDADPKKGITAAKKMLSDAGITDLSDENIFIVAACGRKGIDFLLGKGELGVRLIDKKSAEPAATAADKPAGYTVTVNGTTYAVSLTGDKAVVNGKSYNVAVKDGVAAGTAAPAPSAGSGETEDSTPVNAPMPGKVVRIPLQVGDTVKTGDVVLILEAMKMEVEIKAPVSGTVSSVDVTVGSQIVAGAKMITIN
ncbi:MAG: biotin/lipoyl-binding protein [Chitinispirillaceae bacterium]|jgi:pyruvate carboxylase subunit B|nr:biotin/lipoyl-binding protein [Chitinispirillaceae bacterium]